MAILPIRLYPDSILRQPCKSVEVFDDSLARLVSDMVETMVAAPGIGLAAPQVGVSCRLAVVDLSIGKKEEDLLVLVNPRLSQQSGSWEDEEGCLSIPGLNERVSRPERLRVEAQDLTGVPFTFEADGMLARVVSHEVDHLQGVLFVDHLSGLRRERARRVLRRLSREVER